MSERTQRTTATRLERKILQFVHDSWQKTLAGPQRRQCNVLADLGPELPLAEYGILVEALAALVERGWLTRHGADFYEGTDAGEAQLDE